MSLSFAFVPSYGFVQGSGPEGSALGGLGQIGSAISNITSLVFGGGGTIAKPLDIIHNLMPNMPLASGILQTLSKAFNGAPINIKIPDSLKLPSQDAGVYQSLTQFAAYIEQLSQSLGSKGVQTTSNGSSLDIWELGGAALHGAVNIAYTDLIGQPTWVGINQIMVKTVMRCDIRQGGYIILPPGVAIVGQGAGWMGAKSGAVSFGGSYQVQEVRHVGNFRNPDGNDWCTLITALVDGGVGSTSVGDENTAAKAAATAPAPAGLGHPDEPQRPAPTSSLMRRPVRRM
jgi:hypothetical protein